MITRCSVGCWRIFWGTEPGFKCERQFASPPEVLEALSRETAPDIILLDVEMGEHNGLEAVRPIKALAPEAHVLMLTTFSGPGGRERAFREGASDFMLKSWRMPEIVSHIRQAMEFGSVAGLMTAFLNGRGCRAKSCGAQKTGSEAGSENAGNGGLVHSVAGAVEA